MKRFEGNMGERPFDLCDGDKNRIATLVDEIARSNAENTKLKSRIKELDEENSNLCAHVAGLNLLQEEHKLLKNEVMHLKVTCKFLEGNNASILRKCNELQLRSQENIIAQDGKLDNILQERQTLILKTQKLKYKVKQLQEINQKMCEEVERYKKHFHGKCDAAVQVPVENQKFKKEGRSSMDNNTESLENSSNVQHDIRKIRKSNSISMNEEAILNDLFFGRSSDKFLFSGRNTIINYI